MILSLFPIDSLTRALPVSKHWNSAILNSPQLRRILFLEPAPAKIHLEWKTDVDARWYEEKEFAGRAYHPVIVSQASQSSKVVVVAHPILQPRGHLFTSLETHWVDCKRYKMVPRLTLLFQPPLAKVLLQMRGGDDITIERREGVTFGDIYGELHKLKFWNPKSALRASLKESRLGSLRDLKDERDENQRLDKVEMSAKELQDRSDAKVAYSRRKRLTCLGLKAEGAVPDNATCVQAALQALIREEQNCPVERHKDKGRKGKDGDEDDDDYSDA